MSTVLVDEIAEKAAGLSSKERCELIQLLQEQEKSMQNNSLSISSVSIKLESDDKKKASPNIEWLKENRAEYMGNYVALKDGELIAFGKTIKEADTKAKEKGFDKTLLHYIPAKDEEVWGGW
jgi:Family of unknown function (DUF5678)